MKPPTATQPPEIKRLLKRLRRRVRLYVWAEGLAGVLVVLGLLFWAGLALDWLFEPSREVRIAALVAAGIMSLFVLYRDLINRAFARLTDANMAMLLEKHFDQFHDSLLTTVELTEHPDHATDFNPEMVQHTRGEATQQVTRIRLGDVFNPRPLVRNVALAVLLLASIVAFGVLASDSLAFYLDRVQLSEQLWPRRVRLVVEGFPQNDRGVRTVKVARGTDYDLAIKSDNGPRYETPDRVEVRFRLDDGSRGRAGATRLGDALPSDEFQGFAYTFKNVFESHTFDVIGGDDRVRDLRIEAVDSPEIIDMTLDSTYPPYMGRAPRSLAVTGAMQIPRGTQLTIRAKANKDLVQVRVFDPDEGEPIVLDLADAEQGEAAPKANPRQFELPLPALMADRLLLFALRDADGIETPEHYRLSLSAIPDDAPQVNVALSGIGTAVTPMARIPMKGKVTDDYGLARVWFAHRGDDVDDLSRTAVSADAAGVLELQVDHQLDLEPMQLKPQQNLIVMVQASDHYNLDGGPNEGSSQRFILDVVTPDELRAMLEGRELLLRRRFETIYNEMIDTRDLMARIDFRAPNEADDGADQDAEGEKDETEQRADESPEDAAERALARRKLRIVRALQNTQRYRHEVLSVAESIDAILAELTNNGIDTPELQSRLADGVSAPLKLVADPAMTELESLLEDLEKKTGDSVSAPPAWRTTLAQADRVIVEMKQVLDRMLDLEDYNEILDLLRDIIKEQQHVSERTKELRGKKLRNLLED